MNRNYIIIITLLINLTLFGQTDPTERATGLIDEDETYDQLPREPLFEGTKYNDLPLKVDLSSFCPEVGDQGRIQSCVGWAIGYGALTIQRAIQSNMRDKRVITKNANSALFIYNQIKQNKDCNSGAKISDAVQFIRENGDCLSANFDAAVNDCGKLPNSALQKEAANYTVADFMTLFEKEAPADIKKLKIQRALANGQPVVIGLKITRNFATLQNMTYWNPAIGNTNSIGSHAMVVVGYDEFKDAFLIMNSWGREWGTDGFIWIKYADFTKNCKYAYVLHLEEKVPTTLAPTNEVAANTSPATTQTQTLPNRAANTTQQARISGSFSFKFLEKFDGEAPAMKDAAVTYQNGFYRVNRTDWEMGQFFQLMTKTSSKNEYIYVFSVDNEGEVNIHWPRQAALSDRFVGMNESALVTTAGAEIYIPGKERGLRLSKKGTEHLVILFSKREIENVRDISNYMSGQKANFYGSLAEILEEFMIPTSEIQFSPNSIEFATNSTTGFIVPLVVELEAR